MNPALLILMARWGAWAPTNISGLHSWYDAADTQTITSSNGLVSQWLDKSGNSRHATQASDTHKPTTGALTLNGRNVISAPSILKESGGKQLYAPASITNNALTFFAVSCKIGAGSSGNVYDRILSLYNTSNDYDYDSLQKFQAFYSTQSFGGATAPVVCALRNNTAISAQHLSYGTANVTMVQLNNTVVTLTHNGTTTTGTTSPSLLNVNRQCLMANAPTWENDSSLYGYMAEHILYNRVLDASEIENVTTYLKTKWGIA